MVRSGTLSRCYIRQYFFRDSGGHVCHIGHVSALERTRQISPCVGWPDCPSTISVSPGSIYLSTYHLPMIRSRSTLRVLAVP